MRVARGVLNSAICVIRESLDMSGFEKAYSLFKVCGVKGNIMNAKFRKEITISSLREGEVLITYCLKQF